MDTVEKLCGYADNPGEYKLKFTFHPVIGEAVTEIEQLRSQVSALQAENEGLRGVITDAVAELQDAPEINPCNYDHAQVCSLNTQACYVFKILGDSLSGGDA